MSDTDSFKLRREDATAGLPVDTPVTTQTGLAAIAFNFALKYHDINTVQDGTLYQQYKLEGRNMETLHLDMVFYTAEQIERHLLNSSSRLALLVLEAVAEDIDGILSADDASGIEAEGGDAKQAPSRSDESPSDAQKGDL